MIRKYCQDDLDRLRELTAAGFEGVCIDQAIENAIGPVGGRDWRWRKARHIDDDAAANPDGVFVYVLNGIVVGYITTRVDEESKVGSIPNMAVDRSYRERGIGRDLMNTALEYLKESGMECVRIETLAHNSIGSSFYPSAGFKEVARQIHYVKKL